MPFGLLGYLWLYDILFQGLLHFMICRALSMGKGRAKDGRRLSVGLAGLRAGLS